MESKDNKKYVKTDLDMSLFNDDLKCSYIDIPITKIREVQKKFHDQMLCVPKMKPLLSIEGVAGKKRLLLQFFEQTDPNYKRLQDYIEAANGTMEFKHDHKVELTYENFSMSEAVQMIFKSSKKDVAEKDEEPLKENDVPKGFEIIGDIAHMNLNKRQFPFRYQIGQVVLDKNPKLRTVVMKVGQIESEFRYYNLECIAGEKDQYETIQMEDKVRFKVDVSKVYWCSKLSTERNRLIAKYLNKGNQVLCDIMCGIGPLAVKSAAKVKGLKVVCNDLNPEGIRYVKENVQLNKVGDRVLPFNMDGREFVKFHVAQSNEEKPVIPLAFQKFDHCYMNLPVIAVEFLDAFRGLFLKANPKVWWKDPTDQKTLMLPMIHVNGFTYESEHDAAIKYFANRIGKAMSYPKFSPDDIECFHNIRDVSGTSHMYCVSFRLPWEVAMHDDLYESDQKELKKQKTHE